MLSTYNDTDDKLNQDILIAGHGSAQNHLAQSQIALSNRRTTVLPPSPAEYS